VSHFLVNQRFTLDLDEVERSTEHDQVIEDKKWRRTKTCFTDTLIGQVEDGVATRALMKAMWILCRDGANYKHAQIALESQRRYHDALQHHNSFQSDDNGVIMEACQKLAKEMENLVPSSLYKDMLDAMPDLKSWSHPSKWGNLPLPIGLLFGNKSNPDRDVKGRNAWYHGLPANLARAFRDEHGISIREIDVMTQPMQFLVYSCTDGLLLRANAHALLFAIFLL
jgi:hypothetical protein